MLSFGVGWLLVRCWVSGMTHVVVPVVQVAACCGQAAVVVVCCVVCGCCVRTG